MSLSGPGSRYFHAWTQAEGTTGAWAVAVMGDRPVQGWSPKECHVKPGKLFRHMAWNPIYCLILKNATIHRSCGCLLPPQEKSVTVLETWLWFFWSASLVAFLPPWHPILCSFIFVKEWHSGLSAKLPFQGIASWISLLPKFPSVLHTYYCFSCLIFLEILPDP